MKKLLIGIMCILTTMMLTGCNNLNDKIEVINKNSWIFNNVNIEIKDGYFYKSHEKFTVDDNTIAVTIYFSKESEEDSWD